VTKLIRGHADLELDHCTKSVIRFAPKIWDAIDGLPEAAGWTPSKRNLLFEFRFNVGKLSLHCSVNSNSSARSPNASMSPQRIVRFYRLGLGPRGTLTTRSGISAPIPYRL
jgi:hypothetical protein